MDPEPPSGASPVPWSGVVLPDEVRRVSADFSRAVELAPDHPNAENARKMLRSLRR